MKKNFAIALLSLGSLFVWAPSADALCVHCENGGCHVEFSNSSIQAAEIADVLRCL